jgi:16S rRNA (guanine527-N7)-methyltransferase
VADGPVWPPTGSDRDAMLSDLLTEARALGFLGAGPVSRHIDHSRALAALGEESLAARGVRDELEAGSVRSVVDLGSGAGVPGLILALRWQNARVVLVDANVRRGAFLFRAVQVLGLSRRVTVVTQRAEDFGRTRSMRESFDLVTARGFGRPAVVAECAAPLLRIGGLLVVSEPPPDLRASGARWPAEGLAELGMGQAEPLTSEYHFVVVEQRRVCPLRYPRRVGVPAKRPLF